MGGSHSAALGKRGCGRKANAKGDAKNGKPFHAETPSNTRLTHTSDVRSQSAATIKLNFISASSPLNTPSLCGNRRSLLAELEQARAGASDDRQFGAATAAIVAKAGLAGLDRENGNGSGDQFSKCEGVEEVLVAWLAEYASPGEALAELDAWREQVIAYAANRATVVTSAEPAKSRPDEVGLALGYLRRRR